MFSTTRLTTIKIPTKGLQPRRKAHLLKLLAKSYDKYYTAPAVAASLFALATKWSAENLPADALARLRWIEPAAGGGAFMLPGVVAGFDIYPDEDGPASIQQLDFLDEPARLAALAEHSDAVLGFIGNPPFSANGAQAAAFIDAALRSGPVCAFVLPSSANRHTFVRRLPSRYRLAAEFPVDANSFTLCGDPYECPSVFQIWTTLPGVDLRPPRPVNTHPDFAMTPFTVEGRGEAARVLTPRKFAGVRPGDLLVYSDGYSFYKSENLRGLSALPAPCDLEPGHWMLLRASPEVIDRLDAITCIAARPALIPLAARIPGYARYALVAAYSARHP